jgi:hypothetical protein
MKDKRVIHGSCLCGAVKLEIQEPLEHSPEACHCTQCRKQTGSYFIGVNIRRTALHIRGAESVKWYQSSEKVQRGFCSVCGSTLFWKPTIDGYEWTSVAMGCIDSLVDLRIAKHTFTGDKGGYYDITDGAPQSPGY